MQLKSINEVLSPLSGKIMYKQFRTASAQYKGVEVFYEFEYYEDEGREFTTTASDDRSMNNLKKAYQDKMKTKGNKMWGEMNSTEKCEYLKTINHLGNEEFYKKLDVVGFQKYKEQNMERPRHDETEELWGSITGEIDNDSETAYDSFKGILYRDLMDAISEYKESVRENGMEGTNFVQKEGDLDNQPEMMIRTTSNPEWEPLTGTLDVKDNPSISIQNTIVPPEIGDEEHQLDLCYVWDKTSDNDALDWWGGLNVSEKMNTRRYFGLADQIGISLVDIKLMYEIYKNQKKLNNKPKDYSEALEWWRLLNDKEKTNTKIDFGIADKIGVNLDDIEQMYEMKTQEMMEKSSQDEDETVRAEGYNIVIDIANCGDTKFLASLIKYMSDGTIIVKRKSIDGDK